MQFRFRPATEHVERPTWTWIAVALEVFTGVAAIPVGLMLITDPTGAGIGLPPAWIEGTVFGNYAIPGIYLLVVNGIGMLLVAALTVLRHWIAPWLTGALGAGLVIWILVQLAIMPETMVLQWIFLAIGIVMGFTALFWLRRTGQLVLR